MTEFGELIKWSLVLIAGLALAGFGIYTFIAVGRNRELSSGDAWVINMILGVTPLIVGCCIIANQLFYS